MDQDLPTKLGLENNEKRHQRRPDNRGDIKSEHCVHSGCQNVEIHVPHRTNNLDEEGQSHDINHSEVLETQNTTNNSHRNRDAEDSEFSTTNARFVTVGNTEEQNGTNVGNEMDIRSPQPCTYLAHIFPESYSESVANVFLTREQEEATRAERAERNARDLHTIYVISDSEDEEREVRYRNEDGEFITP